MAPTREDGLDADNGSTLDPDELDIEERENVVSLDDGRFVIGANSKPRVPETERAARSNSATDRTVARSDSSPAPAPDPPSSQPSRPSSDSTTDQTARTNSNDSPTETPTPSSPDSSPTDSSAGNTSAAGTGDSSVNSRTVRNWLESDLRDVNSRYGFHITAKSEGKVSHQQTFSDDIGTVFDSLLMWYAQQLNAETPVEDVLGILLMESDLRVRYAPRCLDAVLDEYDLDEDDDIGDLLEVVEDQGMVFPPSGTKVTRR